MDSLAILSLLGSAVAPSLRNLLGRIRTLLRRAYHHPTPRTTRIPPTLRKPLAILEGTPGRLQHYDRLPNNCPCSLWPLLKGEPELRIMPLPGRTLLPPLWLPLLRNGGLQPLPYRLSRPPRLLPLRLGFRQDLRMGLGKEYEGKGTV